jgi:hypothetical protein
MPTRIELMTDWMRGRNNVSEPHGLGNRTPSRSRRACASQRLRGESFVRGETWAASGRRFALRHSAERRAEIDAAVELPSLEHDLVVHRPDHPSLKDFGTDAGDDNAEEQANLRRVVP